VNTRTYPRHARRWGLGSWAGRMAEPGRLRPQADREAPQPPARHDPLVHPVAITEHCVIGDQIRVPAARCDMAGCVSGFADPAALGEAHNRARALAASWGEDAFGRLVCPACQQRYRVAPARRDLQRQPGTAAEHATAEAVTGPGGGVSQSARSLAARWRRAMSPGQRGRRRRTCSSHWQATLTAGPHRTRFPFLPRAKRRANPAGTLSATAQPVTPDGTGQPRHHVFHLAADLPAAPRQAQRAPRPAADRATRCRPRSGVGRVRPLGHPDVLSAAGAERPQLPGWPRDAGRLPRPSMTTTRAVTSCPPAS